MRISGLVDEDFVNYKKPSMFLGAISCDWKCCTEQGLDISTCQNSTLTNVKCIDISADEIFRRYIENDITKAIVIGGLEPMLQFEEVLEVIQRFRSANCQDDFVVYTGYYPSEMAEKIEKLAQYHNVIVKFGRYQPGHQPHFDEVLGVKLASDNQFARRIECFGGENGDSIF
ncbi:MAG: 4Fe-4S cluster-binding domain-containing protein [Enterocloster asparagiformis]|nr:4Fe-4S cluster-binding domain-containing protein [Enterocloster asparagiformis]